MNTNTTITTPAAVAAQAKEAARLAAYAKRDAAYSAKDLATLDSLFKIFKDEEDLMILEDLIKDIDPAFFARENAQFDYPQDWND